MKSEFLRAWYGFLIENPELGEQFNEMFSKYLDQNNNINEMFSKFLLRKGLAREENYEEESVY